MTKKLAIIGFSTATSRPNPWPDAETEVWGFNELYRVYDPTLYRFTRWFELHIRSYFANPEWHAHALFLNRLLDLGVTVYLPKRDAAVIRSKFYPRAKVAALSPHGEYHAGSFDWMVALAIAEGFTEITLYGVDFAGGGEPISARACLEYWLGVAEGRGIVTRVVGGDVFRIFHLTRSDTPYGFAPFRLVQEAS